MISVVLSYLAVCAVFCAFALLVLAVVTPSIRRRAFDDGFYEGRRAERLRSTPSPVRLVKQR